VPDQDLSNTPVDELVALALRVDRDSDQYRRVLGELHARGGQSTHEIGTRLQSDGRGERELILGIQIRDHLADELSKTPADELVAMALELDRGPFLRWYWRVVGELRMRGDQSTFERASSLVIDGPGERERMLGVDILARLGAEEPSPTPFLEQSLPLVESCAGPDQSAGMIAAAVKALDAFGDERAMAVVLANVNHLDPAVRAAVARALPHVSDRPPPPAVVDALLALMEDADSEVRDCATFALASQTDVDTPEVRDALFARIGDEGRDGAVAVEALRGLACRHDPRALEPTIRWLETPDRLPGDYFIFGILEAAQTLADSRCLPLLHALCDEWNEDPNAFRNERDERRLKGALAEAIRECEPGPAPVS